MASRKRPGWGGPRKGSGRRPGTGAPVEQVRRNRITTTLTDAELSALKRLADEAGVPVGTMLYDLVKRRLR